jgi:hypothetical protein
LKCLSIKQPWAWLIFNDSGVQGLKDVENRTWHTKIRGTVAIQASKSIDKEAYYGLIEYGGHNLPPLKELETGKIIGVVDIIDSVEKYPSQWKELDSIGFVLNNPVKLKVLIPQKGQLNFFNLHETIVCDINKQIS